MKMGSVNIITVKNIVGRTLAYYILLIVVLMANLSTSTNNTVFVFTFATLIITMLLFVMLLWETEKF
jgi:hypothetical protein